MKILSGIGLDVIKRYELLYQQAYEEFKDFIIKHKDEIRKSISDNLIKDNYSSVRYSFDLYKAIASHIKLESVKSITSKQLSLQIIVNKLNKDFFDDDISLESITRRETRYCSAIDFNFRVSLKFEEKFKNITDNILLK